LRDPSSPQPGLFRLECLTNRGTQEHSGQLSPVQWACVERKSGHLYSDTRTFDTSWTTTIRGRNQRYWRLWTESDFSEFDQHVIALASRGMLDFKPLLLAFQNGPT